MIKYLDSLDYPIPATKEVKIMTVGGSNSHEGEKAEQSFPHHLAMEEEGKV